MSRRTARVFLLLSRPNPSSSFFFFNDTATTEIYTLSLHDALPICCPLLLGENRSPDHRCLPQTPELRCESPSITTKDRKSTRLNSSHSQISYAVFCLKKKKQERPNLI